MVFNPASWVNPSVRARIAELELRSTLYTESDRTRWHRMASDPRMKSVFESSYLKNRLTAAGWRIWFDQTWRFDIDELDAERKNLTEYVRLMTELDRHLGEASTIINAIKDLNPSNIGRPRAMSDLLFLIEETVADAPKSGNQKWVYFFEKYAKPILDKLSSFYFKSLPSVPEMLTTLSERTWIAVSELESNGATYESPEVAAAWASGQRAPVPMYIRFFDCSMQQHEPETGGLDVSPFLMPTSIMAIQTAVAMNLNVVDKSQVKNARLNYVD